MTTSPDTGTSAKAARTAALLAELRGRLEEATATLERAADELVAERHRVDVLENVVDVLLGVCGVPVVVVDGDRRIIGLSAVAGRMDGAAVGRPLVSVLADGVVEKLEAGLAGEADVIDIPDGDRTLTAHRLPGGGAVLVLSAP
ncbi:MAG TPA: hypothetical protein VKZ72_09135 [Acidimicrobiales bacterium]|nr:hypothetical protein [Acidimicrobiales bacterium]